MIFFIKSDEIYLELDKKSPALNEIDHTILDFHSVIITRGSPDVGRNTLFLSSPHLYFIIVFIRDLFVSRDDQLLK